MQHAHKYTKRYDQSLDKTILAKLYPNNPLSFNKLYNEINLDRPFNKQIPKGTFDFHIRKLRDQERLIERDIDNPKKGTKVLYSLTEEGRKNYKFYHDSSLSKKQIDEEKTETFYQLLFFIEVVSHPIYKIESEQELEYFLSQNHKSKGDLVADFSYSGGRPQLRLEEDYKENNPMEVGPIFDTEKGKIRIESDILYYDIVTTKFKPVSDNFDIWKEVHHYLPLPSNAEPYWPVIYKKEIYKEEISSDVAKSGFFYYVRCDGISMTDLVQEFRPGLLKYIDLTEEEIREGFYRLEKDGIIRPINDLLGEKRYSISPAHESLKNLIREYWKVFDIAFAKMVAIWRYYRRPTYHERKWLELLYGEKPSGKLFVDLQNYRQAILKYQIRRKHRRKAIQNLANLAHSRMRGTINDTDAIIQRYIKSIEEKYSIDTIQRYHFPLKRLMEMIYPQFIQHASITSKNNDSGNNS